MEEISNPVIGDREKFCSLVSRHDNNGLRGGIADTMAQYGDIEYGGLFRHNTDDLGTLYSDNKIEFLKQYKFNICPENSNADGYVTEKLKAFRAQLRGIRDLPFFIFRICKVFG